MSRNGAGVYTLPPGTAATANATATASQFNSRFNDLETDANTARPVVAGGTGATTASTARTNLGLAIGTDVQAYNANLASLSGLTLAADRGLYSTAANTLALFTLTSAGRALLDDADASAQRTTLGLGNIATTNLIDEDDMVSDSAARAPSQQSVKAYADAIANKAIGVGQTWQQPSRSASTSYQNTTGRPIQWMVHGSSGGNAQVSSDNSTWITLAVLGAPASFETAASAIIPDQWYYRTTGAFSNWSELR